MIIKEMIKVILFVIWEWVKLAASLVPKILEIPLTQYGLIKFIAEHNVLLFNSEKFTRIALFIIPFLVTQVLVFVGKKLHIKNIAKNEGTSIVLYLFFILLASYWITWTIFVVILVGSIIYKILCKNVNYY